MGDTFDNGKWEQVPVKPVRFRDEGEDTDGDGDSEHDGKNRNDDMVDHPNISTRSSGRSKEEQRQQSQ